MAKQNDEMLMNLNVTVVALVALVALVGVVAMVLSAQSAPALEAAASPSIDDASLVGYGVENPVRDATTLSKRKIIRTGTKD